MKRVYLTALLVASLALCLPTLGTAWGEKDRKRTDAADRKSERARAERRRDARDGDDAAAASPATAPTTGPAEEPRGAADRKRSMNSERTQGDAAKDAIERQKEIARALAGNNRPPAKPKSGQAAAAQTEGDTENDRPDAKRRPR